MTTTQPDLISPDFAAIGIQYLLDDATTYPWPDADLVIADPPWKYAQKFCASGADDHYAGLPTKEIVRILDGMPGRRLALWCTGPILAEWFEASRGWSWGKCRTQGSWTKSSPEDSGHYGSGFHWAGCAEPVLIYTRKGSTNDRSSPLRSAWIERPTSHSRKPVGWMEQWIRRWVPAMGLVLDPFAGLASVPEATMLAGGHRRCIATEISPQRHTDGLSLLAQFRRDA